MCPWLPRRAYRLVGWLLLAVAGVAVWPVTVVTGAGYAVAWLRGWPEARLGRQAGWALPMSAVWIAAESARGWRAITLDPVRDGASGWPHLTVATVVRTFLLVAPVTLPAGLALAALLRAWRIYAVTTETGGWLASAPITSDGGRRERQVRSAQGRNAAPAPRRASAPTPDPAARIAGISGSAPRLDDILGPGVTR